MKSAKFFTGLESLVSRPTSFLLRYVYKSPNITQYAFKEEAEVVTFLKKRITN